MRLHRHSAIIGFLLALGLPGNAQQAKVQPLTEIYHNNDFQFTGVTVSKSGRIFLNFPRWSDRYVNAVVEVMKDGSIKPFPDETWNKWDMKPATAGNHFVCVQSVVVDSTDALWVVDPAAPLLASVVPGGAKLVKIDLQTNKVVKVFPFGSDIARPNSYLNDVRVDTQRNTAYMTDSGAGGIVVLDLSSGKAHRALDGNPSVMVEHGIQISVNGKPVVGADGKPPQFASDGIALSPDGNTLYYKAVTGANLYGIKTSLLRDAGTSAQTLGAAVEKVAQTFPTDGLWMDPQGRLYLSGINQSTVLRLSKDGKIENVAGDSRLEWPDTFSQGPDGAIYITASHINDEPQYNHGKSTRTKPYTLFKFTP